ncbi:MAG: hypothetical protein QW279_14400 [Candidatus Jordarchaeaceae archaeon]
MKKDWEKIARRLANALDELMQVEGGEPDKSINEDAVAVWAEANKSLIAFNSMKNRA